MCKEYKDIGDIYGKEVEFPINERLSIIIGENGSGKTQLLHLLNNYFKSKNENVVFINDNHCFQGNTITMSNLLSADIISDKLTNGNKYENLFFAPGSLEYELNCLEKYNYDFSSCDNGIQRFINIIGNVLMLEDGILLIDEIDAMFSLMLNRTIVDFILSFDNIKKLIVATHSPETFMGHINDVYEMENLYIRKIGNEVNTYE